MPSVLAQIAAKIGDIKQVIKRGQKKKLGRGITWRSFGTKNSGKDKEEPQIDSARLHILRYNCYASQGTGAACCSAACVGCCG